MIGIHRRRFGEAACSSPNGSGVPTMGGVASIFPEPGEIVKLMLRSPIVVPGNGAANPEEFLTASEALSSTSWVAQLARLRKRTSASSPPAIWGVVLAKDASTSPLCCGSRSPFIAGMGLVA